MYCNIFGYANFLSHSTHETPKSCFSCFVILAKLKIHASKHDTLYENIKKLIVEWLSLWIFTRNHPSCRINLIHAILFRSFIEHVCVVWGSGLAFSLSRSIGISWFHLVFSFINVILQTTRLLSHLTQLKWGDMGFQPILVALIRLIHKLEASTHFLFAWVQPLTAAHCFILYNLRFISLSGAVV